MAYIYIGPIHYTLQSYHLCNKEKVIFHSSPMIMQMAHTKFAICYCFILDRHFTKSLIYRRQIDVNPLRPSPNTYMQITCPGKKLFLTFEPPPPVDD